MAHASCTASSVFQCKAYPRRVFRATCAGSFGGVRAALYDWRLPLGAPERGTGGVSIFAAQIAAAHGANVIVTSSKDGNLAKVKSLIPNENVRGINYRTHSDWASEVLRLTDGLGADITLDVAGGEGINQSVAATRVQGVIALVGFLTGQQSDLNLMPLIFRQTTIRGIAVAPRSSFERMNVFLNEKKIKPVIDHVYDFGDAVQAFEHLARGPFGKVVIKVANT